ncbi:MAG: hypothetical protein RLN76_02025 [Phycisphaeraceae bacterium]
MTRSKPQPTTLMRKLRTTPLLDLIRGRLSGRLDWRGLIERCDLPEPCRGMVLEVTRRTRLWRRERYEVAGELIAHFGDGLEAGATAETLVERFGDVRQTARLIRRAKVRGRSAVYHARVWMGRGIGAVVVGYVLAAVWLSVGEPEPMSVDEMIKAINAPIEDMPEDQRAWPELRELLLTTDVAIFDTEVPYEVRDSYLEETGENVPRSLTGLTPAHALWPMAEEVVEDGASVIQKVINLTQGYKHLGYTIEFEFRMPEDDYRVMMNLSAHESSTVPVEPDWNVMSPGERLARQSSVPILLPQLGVLRRMARLLELEAMVAQERGDAVRVIECSRALLQLGDWSSEQPLLISCLVDLSIKSIAHKRIGHALHAAPEVYSDEQLKELAHMLAGMTISFTSGIQWEERFYAQDILDRLYDENGRLSDEGVEFLFMFDTYLDGNPVSSQSTAPTWAHEKFSEIVTSRWAFRLATPLASLVLADREDMSALQDRFFARTYAYGRLPLGEMVQSDSDDLMEEAASTTIGRFRYMPLVIYLPSMSAAYRTEAVVRNVRDGLVVAIAAELYRREHGDWPETQAQLVPRYLPKVYADESDEQLRPLILGRDETGGLVVYGRGLDGDDDGGQRGKRGWPNIDYHGEDEPIPDSDWILYPPPAPGAD